MTENFPKLISNTRPWTQKAQKTPNGINAKITTKLQLDISESNCTKSQIKRNITKKPNDVGGKYFTYRGLNIRITFISSSEIIQVRRNWSEIVLREKN